MNLNYFQALLSFTAQSSLKPRKGTSPVSKLNGTCGLNFDTANMVIAVVVWRAVLCCAVLCSGLGCCGSLGYAEYATVPAAQAFTLPASLDWLHGAAIPEVWLTA